MFLPRAEYDRLVQQLESAQLALEQERAENRRTERWQMDMLLRRAGSFPVPAKADASVTKPITDGPLEPADIDPGELAAMVEAGEQYGVGPDEVKRLLRAERGLE